MTARPDAMDAALLKRLPEARWTFVFPSEIVAENRLRRSLVLSGVFAIRDDRFIGWDTFKEKIARRGTQSTPSNARLRALFSARLLADNARRPFLRSLIPSSAAIEAASSYAPYVAKKLPALRALSRSVTVGERNDLVADWLTIHDRYERFLAECNLFEPSYAPPEIRAGSERYLIFLPELMEDYDEYGDALRDSGIAETFSISKIGTPDLYRFVERGSALAELRGTLRAIGTFLDRGESPTDMAISVAGLDAYRPYLEREAELLSVPLEVRSGRPLASFPGGTLFGAMADAVATGFSFEATRTLVGSPALPWKRADLNARVLEAGLSRHAVAPFPSGSRIVDPWDDALRDDVEAAEHFRGLRKLIQAVAKSDNFHTLKTAFMRFRAVAFSETGWIPSVDRVVARCVRELDAFAQAEVVAGFNAPDPFGMAVRAMMEQRYVPADGRGGVRVYEWRVAAGAAFDRHFLLGAAQNEARVAYSRFDFLGDELRWRCGGEDRDVSADFLDAYATTPGNALFSCPRRGFSSEQTPHGALLLNRVVVPAPEALANEDDSSAAIDAAIDEPIALDEYHRERSYLRGRGPVPGALHDPQIAGAERAFELGLAPRLRGLTDGVAPRSLRDEAARAALGDRLRSSEEDADQPGLPFDGDTSLLALDATTIDAYRTCGFAELVLRLLDAAPEPSGIEFADDRFLGDVYHAALADLWSLIGDRGGSFSSVHVDDYRALVAGCTDIAFRRLSAQKGRFVGAVLDAYRDRVVAHIARVVEREASDAEGYFNGTGVGPIERRFSCVFAEPAVVLSGRIDRIALKDGRAVVVDYKKGGSPAASRVRLDDDGALGDSQMACYAELVQAAGLRFASAWYVEIEGKSGLDDAGIHKAVLGDAPGSYVPELELKELQSAFGRALTEVAAGMRAGRFFPPPHGERDRVCKECRARSICRQRYAARAGTVDERSLERAIDETDDTDA